MRVRVRLQRLACPLRRGTLEALGDLEVADLVDLRVALCSLEAGLRLLPWRLLGRLWELGSRRCSGERLRVRLLPERCLRRLLRAAAGDALEEPDALRLVAAWESLSARGAAVRLLPRRPRSCSGVARSSDERVPFVPCSVSGTLGRSLCSGSWELCDVPNAAWLSGMEPKVSGSMELLDGPGAGAVWLAVLGAANSALALEAVRGGRKVMSLELQQQPSGICHPTWGRQTLATVARALAGRPCLAPARCLAADCLLPVARPAQLLHSHMSVVLLKWEHCRWVPSAAQELHRMSSQGLGKQRGCGCEGRVIQAREFPAQHVPVAQCLLPQPAVRLRSPAEPQRAAVVTHPLLCACSLPPW